MTRSPAFTGRDARPDALHHAGEFRGRRERQRRLGLVLAGDDQRVEEIQRRGFDAHHSFAGRGDGIGNVRKLEIIGRAVAGAEQCFHGAS